MRIITPSSPTPPRNLLKHLQKPPPPPSADSAEEKREPKALPAFHPLPYYSFIPAVLVMVLRLALDVLTKLLNWQKVAVVMVMVVVAVVGAPVWESYSRELSMRMF